MNVIADIQRNHLPAADPIWLAKSKETAIEPELPIIDPHHHLWRAPRAQYLLDEFWTDINAGHNVIATICVECPDNYRTPGPKAFRPVGETEFAAAIGDKADQLFPKSRLNAGIISRVDLADGDDARALLEAHIAAGRGRFKGVRFSTHRNPRPEKCTTARTPPPGLLLGAPVGRGVQHVAELGLVLDLWLSHHQLSDAAKFAGENPDVSLVLDHLGGPPGFGPYAGQREEGFAAWRKGLLEVAHHRNVVVKLGGLGMKTLGFDFREWSAPPSGEELAVTWRPYIETAIEAFGPERAMFESNFPVDQMSSPYVVLWNAFKHLTRNYSADERTALFSGTAARVYAIDL